MINKLILIFTLIIISFSGIKADWEQCTGTYNLYKPGLIFEFNSKIYAELKDSTLVRNYDGTWSISKLSIFDSLATIRVFYQKGQVAIASDNNYKTYVTYDNGESWNLLDDNTFKMYGEESLIIVDDIIFAQEFPINKSLHKLTKGSKKWEKVYFGPLNTDTIVASAIFANSEYIIAGEDSYNSQENTSGSIILSSNQGKSWQKIKEFQYPIKELILFENILYVASNDMLHRSSDMGKTWYSYPELKIDVNEFIVHNGKLYVDALINNQKDYKSEGLYVTDDNGFSWEKVEMNNYSFKRKSFITDGSTLYFLTEYKLLYESNFDISNWDYSKLHNYDVPNYGIKNIDNRLFTNTKNGIFISTDNGDSWHNLSRTVIEKFDNIVDYKAKDSTIIGLSNYNVYIVISTDFGKTWNNRLTEGPLSWTKDILILKDKIILLSNTKDKYNQVSYDNGKSWFDFENTAIKKEYICKEVIQENDDIIYLITDHGIIRTENNGLIWENIGSSDKFEYTHIKKRNGFYYGINSDGILCRTLDIAGEWQSLDYQIPSYFYKDYEIIDDIIIINIIDGVVVTSDFGLTKKEYIIDKSKYNKEFLILNKIAIYGDYLFASSEEGLWRIKLSDLGIVKTNINESFDLLNLEINNPYPMPASNKITFNISNSYSQKLDINSITIYDAKGVIQETIGKIIVENIGNESRYTWDCGDLSAGIYFIQVTDGYNTITKKVVLTD